MAYSPKRAPKMPAVSIAWGASPGQKRNAKAIAANKSDTARVNKIHAEGLAASKRARANAAKGAAMKGGGGQHRGAHGRYV